MMTSKVTGLESCRRWATETPIDRTRITGRVRVLRSIELSVGSRSWKSVYRFRASTRRDVGGSRKLVRFDELKRGGIHAVAQASRFRAVVENVSEVRVASLAQHFNSLHSVTVIFLGMNILFRDRRPEAGPT